MEEGGVMNIYDIIFTQEQKVSDYNDTQDDESYIEYCKRCSSNKRPSDNGFFAKYDFLCAPCDVVVVPTWDEE